MPQREVYKPPVRGGVPDAPRLRDRRAALDASVRHDRQHPRHLRCVRLCPQPHLSNFAGTARAPFLAGVRSCPSTEAGRAWKPAPTGDLYISRCGIRRRGTARAPFGAGVRSCPSSQPREGVEALPYGVVVKCKQQTRIVRRHAQRTRKKDRSEDRSFLCAEMPAGISVFTLCLQVSRRRPGRGCRGGRRQSGRRAGTSRRWA